MKIVVTGGSGVVGASFIEIHSNSGHDLISPSHKGLDILNREEMIRLVSEIKPEFFLHFAAFRDAALAEKERFDENGMVWRTNVEGTKNIVHVCQEMGIRLIHISTDMVFPGTPNNPGPYKEDSKLGESPENLSWYGWSKLNAETIVRENLPNASIIRIGNVTIPSVNPGLDYIGKIFTLYKSGRLYPLFGDQSITLSYIPEMEQVISKIVEERLNGTFHVSTGNTFTPYQLGEYLVNKLGGSVKNMSKSSIDDYLEVNPYRYPKLGGLESSKTYDQLGLSMRTWEQVVDIFVEFINNTEQTHG